MQYLSGTYALNLKDDVYNTPGDWHACVLNWENLPLWNTSDSVFGTWGIYLVDQIKNHQSVFVATHIRACLDLIAQGYFSSAQGMRENFLDDESLTPLLFEKVMELKNKANWQEIDSFMGQEYRCTWLDWKEGRSA